MGYALMWIEGLSAMLLVLALSLACSARWSRRFGQLALPLAMAILIFGVASVLTYGAALLKFRFGGLIPHDWFFYTLSWTIIFLVSTLRILSRGLKRGGAEQVPPARSWPRGRLVLALAGALVLFAITLSNMDLAVKMQLDDARAEASSILLAMTPKTIADKDNAAPLYEQAFAALTPLERWPSRWRDRMADWNRKEWQSSGYWNQWEFPDRLADQFDFRDKEWKALLDSQAKGLALLRKAASKPGCQFPQSDPLASFDRTGLRYDTNSYFAQAAQLVCLDARVQAAAGDTSTAIEDIAALLGIARHMSDGDVEKKGWETLAAVLQLSTPSSRDLSRLLQVEGTPYLREFPKVQNVFALRVLVSLLANWPAGWFWDLTREVTFLHRTGRPMPEGYEAPIWFQGTVVPLVRVFLFPDDLLFIQRSLRESRQALQSPQAQSFTDWQELKQSLEEQRGGYLFLGPWKTRLDAMARFACDVATLRRLSQIAIALKEYQAKHGSYPESLDELKPAFLERIPTDPWDGGRLHSKRTEKGVGIYTLRNGTGQPVLSPNSSKERRDIVFHLEGK